MTSQNSALPQIVAKLMLADIVLDKVGRDIGFDSRNSSLGHKCKSGDK